MKNYLVKIRGGVEVDSAGKKAGKGPLIAEEISHTLGTSQDQYLFQAVEEKSKAIGFMRGLGGVQTMNEKMPTLQAANGTSGNNKPCVAVGVDRYNQATTGNVMPTLKTPNGGDDIPCVVCYSFDSMASNSMKSKNPHSGCRAVEVAKCLDTSDTNPSKNQGGIAVVQWKEK